jgi:hypothetical protein
VVPPARWRAPSLRCGGEAAVLCGLDCFLDLCETSAGLPHRAGRASGCAGHCRAPAGWVLAVRSDAWVRTKVHEGHQAIKAGSHGWQSVTPPVIGPASAGHPGRSPYADPPRPHCRNSSSRMCAQEPHAPVAAAFGLRPTGRVVSRSAAKTPCTYSGSTPVQRTRGSGIGNVPCDGSHRVHRKVRRLAGPCGVQQSKQSLTQISGTM